MMKGIFPIDKFRTLQTPFYYYDTKVLRDTLSAINQEVAKYPSYSVHYAVKANANPKVMTISRLGNQSRTGVWHLLFQCRVYSRTGSHQ